MTDLRVARYRFDLEFLDPAELPVYKGGTLRGGFGYAFQAMACGESHPSVCRARCRRGNACPYGYIFETDAPLARATGAERKAIPRPFVIEPPLDRRRDFRAGDRLSFTVVLMGNALRYLAYFMLAFQELGRRGLGAAHARFALQRILAEHPWDGRKQLVFDGVEMHVGGPDLSVGWAEIAARAAALHPRAVTVEFLTPTHLTRHNRSVGHPANGERLEFAVLARALLRRSVDVSAFHTAEPFERDFRALTEAAEAVQLERQNVSWVDWERYSTRQQRTVTLGGLVGTLAYHGDLRPFREVLALGELIHVGKATVFGHGCYRLE
jgi:hypothetical protein